jgi:ATP/maltotriose-dependent transcriptional regulator MalT
MMGAMGATAASELIDQGWAALGRSDWAEAQRSFEAAVARDGSGEALDGLAWASWWRGDGEAALGARERAFRAYRRDGHPRRAAWVAGWLATDTADFRGDFAVAQGWLRRGRRLLDDAGPCPELGWLGVHEAEKHLLHSGDLATARSLGEEAARLGRRFGETDLEVLGLAMAGFALVAAGELDEGVAQLDEAAAAALAGELSQRWAIYWCVCLIIHACELVRDHDRAIQWCRRLEEWSERSGLEAFSRSCRAYHAGVLIWRGAWAEAEAELTASAERLTELRPPWAAEAWVRLGELRRRQGRVDEATALFERAVGHPLALLGAGELGLDRGDPDGARDRALECLRELPVEHRAARAAALDLLIRAEAARGELAAASDALAELDQLAASTATPALKGAAAHGRGLLELGRGRYDDARVALEDAARHYLRSGMPFEQARTRLALARALAAVGRRDDAAGQARAAAESFHRLGAPVATATARALSSELAGPLGGRSPLTGREREVLRLVAEGCTNRKIADALVISEHTVNRHVTNILTKLGVATRTAAVAEAMRRQLL